MDARRTLRVLVKGHCRVHRYNEDGRPVGIDDVLARRLDDWWYRKRVLRDGFEKGFVVTTDVSFELPDGFLSRLRPGDHRCHGLRVERPDMALEEGYWWDGASGPTLDTADTLLASLFHDAAYSALRMGWVRSGDEEGAREEADAYFRRLLARAGASGWRCWLWYQGVRVGGSSAAAVTEGDELSERDQEAFAKWLDETDPDTGSGGIRQA